MIAPDEDSAYTHSLSAATQSGEVHALKSEMPPPQMPQVVPAVALDAEYVSSLQRGSQFLLMSQQESWNALSLDKRALVLQEAEAHFLTAARYAAAMADPDHSTYVLQCQALVAQAQARNAHLAHAHSQQVQHHDALTHYYY